jgi:hypothetical protein
VRCDPPAVRDVRYVRAGERDTVMWKLPVYDLCGEGKGEWGGGVVFT